MRPGDALDCSDPSNVQKRRQPYPDPYQVLPATFAAQRPNWGLPYEFPVVEAVETAEPILRSEDV